MLAAARVIWCGYKLPAGLLDCACIQVSDLDTLQARALCAREMKTATRKTSDAKIRSYIADLGGNPLERRTRLWERGRYDPAQIARRLYAPVWESFSPAARQTWLTLARQPAAPLSQADGLFELDRAALLDKDCALTPLAQRFAETILRQTTQRNESFV